VYYNEYGKYSRENGEQEGPYIPRKSVDRGSIGRGRHHNKSLDIPEKGRNAMKRGRAWRFGDNIDIDLILPTHYIALPPDKYKDHCMEGILPSFSQEIRPGDYLVAGKNFGCGNTHHQGNIAIRDLGVAGVIAESFGRNFFRASVAVGLPILECSSAKNISEGDEIEADFRTGKIVNLAKNEEYEGKPLEEPMKTILEKGGIIPYLKESK